MLTLTRYEFYYDVYLGGQYTFEIGRMHEKYGPIIRINPYELHVSSPDFIEKLYTGPGKRRDRWSWMTSQFGVADAIFGTTGHDSHRIRRAAVSPFFSKGAVRRLQPIVDERIDALLGRFREFQASGEPITLNYAFAAYTNGLSVSRDIRTFTDCIRRHCARVCLCEIGSSSRST
jgi:cytochrome P450